MPLLVASNKVLVSDDDGVRRGVAESEYENAPRDTSLALNMPSGLSTTLISEDELILLCVVYDIAVED